MGGLNFGSAGFVGSLGVAGSAAALPAGPVLPALNWLARFSADTGLVNQVSGGPNLVVTTGTTPTAISGAYGSRAAWSFNPAHPDFFDLALTNTAVQHWLVAVVVTPTYYGSGGGMLLGASTTSPAEYWQVGPTAVSAQVYGQATLVSGALVALNTPTVLVYYVSADGNMRFWANGTVYLGSAAQPISPQNMPLQIGKYPAGINWNYGGLMGAHCIAAGTYTDTDAANVGAALRSYYVI